MLAEAQPHSSPVPGRRTGKRYCVVLFIFFFLLFSYAHQDPTRNVTSLSRLDLLHSLFNEARISIDTYHYNTTDKAFFEGSFYSDKPPGTVVVAFPGFLVACAALQVAGEELDSPIGWLVSSWIASALSLGLVSALGACAFFKWLGGWVAPQAAFLSTCGLFLGAAPLPYTTMMFPHALVVSLICIALWVKRFGWREGQIPQSWQSDGIAGLCCGVAAASEFTVGLVIIGLFTAFYYRAWSGARFFVLGALPALFLIPLYNFLCFGNPLTLGYEHQATFAEMKRGLFGVRLPGPAVALHLLFHPAKGLFMWSPFLLLAILGFRKLFFLSPRVFWTCLLIPLVQVIAISGYGWDWPAGYNLTPRYLACMTPFLTLPVALAIERFRIAGTAAVVLSILLVASATLLNASPAFHHDGNFITMYVPEILDGRHAPNLGKWIGLPGLWSCLPFVLVLGGGMTLLYRIVSKGTPAVPRSIRG